MLEMKDNEVGVPYVEGSNEYIEIHTRREDKKASDLDIGEYKLGTPYVNPRHKELMQKEEKQPVTEIAKAPVTEIAKAPVDFCEADIKDVKRKKAVNRLFGKMFSL